MDKPTITADGYPTEETLAAIEQWPYQDAAGCLDFVRAAWHWPDWQCEGLRDEEASVVHAEPDDQYARFATGGWSGNESLIHALKRNQMICTLTWQLSARGGLHIFRYPR
jgi:hypothetical protein